MAATMASACASVLERSFAARHAARKSTFRIEVSRTIAFRCSDARIVSMVVMTSASAPACEALSFPGTRSAAVGRDSVDSLITFPFLEGSKSYIVELADLRAPGRADAVQAERHGTRVADSPSLHWHIPTMPRFSENRNRQLAISSSYWRMALSL